MSTDETYSTERGTNGLAACKIFNQEISLECKCSPTSKSADKSKLKAKRKTKKKDHQQLEDKQFDFTPEVHQIEPKQGVIVPASVIQTKPSVAESRYEIVKKPSIRKKKRGGRNAPAVDIFHEKTKPDSTSESELKPLKPPAIDTDEMARLYDKYLNTKNEEADVTIVTPASTKSTKIPLLFQVKSNKKKKKGDCLNENILTAANETEQLKGPGPKTASSLAVKRDIIKRSIKFFKKSPNKPTHLNTRDFVMKTQLKNTESKESASSDPTVASHDSNSIIDTVPAPDEVSTDTDPTVLDLSVFEVFEQYTGGAFPTHHCSPRLPSKRFEINNHKQAELLSQIEQLKKELSESKGTVQELSHELEDIYSEKDLAVSKLDRMIEFAKINDTKHEEHERLREIRMYLTDRTEPTISSITSAGNYYNPPPPGYHPFCLCFNCRE